MILQVLQCVYATVESSNMLNECKNGSGHEELNGYAIRFVDNLFKGVSLTKWHKLVLEHWPAEAKGRILIRSRETSWLAYCLEHANEFEALDPGDAEV